MLYKVTVNENARWPCVLNWSSRWLQIGHKPEKREWHHNLLAWHHCQFFYVAKFHLSSLATGPSLMSTSWLVLGLWQFLFKKDWPEIQKWEIPPSEFYPISGDCGKLEIPDLVQWMLQIARFTAFTISELLTLCTLFPDRSWISQL